MKNGGLCEIYLGEKRGQAVLERIEAIEKIQ